MYRLTEILPYKRIPVLLYHQIAETTIAEDFHRLAVSAATFETQMGYLHKQGFSTVSLDDIVENNEDTFMGKKFAITFDDGYLDNYTTAFPILEKYGFTAMFFLTTDFLGKYHSWASCKPFPYMHWGHAREMLDHGFSFGSHTCLHPDLTALTNKETEQELYVSRKTIEDKLGTSVVHFSYPFGKYNQRIKEMVVDAGYHSACSVSYSDNDRFSIERFMIASKDRTVRFRIKSSQWSSWIRNSCKLVGVAS